MGNAETAEKTATVLVYSDDVNVRKAVVSAVGESLGESFPKIEWLEIATPEAAKAEYQDGRFAALILDAEAAKEGGISVAKHLEGVAGQMPPVIMLTARPADDWLARWARSAKILHFPVDPFEVSEALRAVLRP